MTTSVSVFNVARVEARAYSIALSEPLSNGQTRIHCQQLNFFDSEDCKIGETTLFLEQPLAALATGDCSRLDGFQESASASPTIAVPTLHLISQVSRF